MRRVLAESLRQSPREIILEVTPYGKPFVPGNPVHFNLSHSREWVVLAVANTPVGVDVEDCKERDLESIAEFLAPEETAKLIALPPPSDRLKAFYEIWTAKESYVKATGTGFHQPFHEFSVTRLPSPWHVCHQPLGDNSILALCMSSRLDPAPAPRIVEFDELAERQDRIRTVPDILCNRITTRTCRYP